MPTPTIREKICGHLVTLFETMTADQPAADPYGWKPSLVTRERWDSLADKKKFAIGVYDTREVKQPGVGRQECRLTVAIEFRVWIEGTQKPSEVMNEVLGVVQRRLGEDISLGGLAINSFETANEIDIDGTNDKQCQGVVFMTVLYRHSEKDPRKAL